MPGKNLFSIAPHAPFLPTLVDAVLEGPLLGDWPRSGPFWLSDVTIILPTQRARLALSEAFARARGGSTLLPDIRSLGAQNADEDAFLPLPGKSQGKLPVGPAERQFLLCQLIRKWISSNPPPEGLEQIDLDNPARILNLAASLAALIDEMETEGTSADALRAPPPDGLDPQYGADLAENFQQNLRFLEIVLSGWPQILAERNRVDASHLKNRRIRDQAACAGEVFADRPVIIAGSTGSVPATAELLGAVCRLPRGCIVLPGLDTSMSPERFERLLDEQQAPHGHPQYGLARLLQSIGATPGDVSELARPAKSGRTELVRCAMALAGETSAWNVERARFSAQDVERATQNLALCIAQGEQEQALCVALAARQARQKGHSVGIITPDRNFARRVRVELARFDIRVDDSAGTPLFQSGVGRLVRQILGAAISQFHPVDLVALFKNPHVTLNRTRATLVRQAEALEYGVLRGQGRVPGIDGLRNILAMNVQGALSRRPALKLSPALGRELSGLLDDLEQAFRPLNTLFERRGFPARDLLGALRETMELLRRDPAGETGSPAGEREFRAWAEMLAETGPDGPPLDRENCLSALQALMQGTSVRTGTPADEGIWIWGRLEARLQSADLMILCTLNEGKWPEAADPGPWLSRSMRLNAGLPPPERQHGLAAHDFEMAIGQEHTLLTCSSRIDSAPALPSRLVERLGAFLGQDAFAQIRNRGERWLDMARSLDGVEKVEPAGRPMPAPPAHLRPRALSVTEIETLVRSPFDIYAKHVLGLRPVDPLGEEPGFRERGTLIHDIFARFIEKKHDVMDEKAFDRLMDIARDRFADLVSQPHQRAIWLHRFAESARLFVEFERQRNANIARRFAEEDLCWEFEVDGERFVLRGRADRIDLRHDGQVEILDFKTGSLPSKSDMKDFLAPQLLLEAAMVRAAGFKGCPPSETAALTYIKVGAGTQAFSPQAFEFPEGMDLVQAREAMTRMLMGRLKEFLLSDAMPMTSRILPKKNQSYPGSYDHLARLDEWSQTGDPGDGE